MGAVNTEQQEKRNISWDGVWGWAYYFLLVLAVLVIIIAALTYLAPHFGFLVNSIASSSMSPALERGTLVVAREVDPDEIKTGDIIVIDQSPVMETMVCHRVIEIKMNSPRRFITKGDANPAPDSFIVIDRNVAGKVIFHLPLAGYFIRFVKTPVGIITTLILPGIILLAIYLQEIISVLKKGKIRGRS